ncbi:MAG: PAS domain S-box protein [Gammaproteobacteria bacterium]|nr:PAS domain S-box protein [Gammaproteobacteria bacterium]
MTSNTGNQNVAEAQLDDATLHERYIRAQSEIAHLKARVERAMEGATSFLWDWENREGTMWVSESMKAVLGYALDPAFKADDASFKAAILPEHWSHIRRLLVAHYKVGLPFECEFQMRRKSGEYRWFRALGSAGQRDHRGRVQRFSGTVIDIHDRKLIERTLAEERAKASVILATISDAVISTNAHGVIEYLNPAAERLLGKDTSEVVGQPFVRAVQLFSDESETPLPDPIAQHLTEGLALTGRQARLRNGPGEEHAIEYSVAALNFVDDPAGGAVVVLRNVTEESRLALAMSYSGKPRFADRVS